jgi:hypothetical protein
MRIRVAHKGDVQEAGPIEIVDVAPRTMRSSRRRRTGGIVSHHTP